MSMNFLSSAIDKQAMEEISWNVSWVYNDYSVMMHVRFHEDAIGCREVIVF